MFPMSLLGTINLQFYDDLTLMLSCKQSWASLIRKVATSCQTVWFFFFAHPPLTPTPTSACLNLISEAKELALS